MMGYTSLYALYVVTSLVMFNALILLARFSRQVKSPPQDEDFEKLLVERQSLSLAHDQAEQEFTAARATIKQLELELQKLEENLKAKTQETSELQNQLKDIREAK